MKARKLALAIVITLSGTLFAQNNANNKKVGEFKKHAQEIQEEVAKIRELRYKSQVDVGLYTIEELKEFLKKEIDDSLTPKKK